MDHNVTYREKDGKIQAIISYKVGTTWKQKSKQGFKRQKDAKPWVNRTLKELQNINLASLDYYDMTVKELIGYFRIHINKNLRYSSVRNYEVLFKHLYMIEDMKVLQVSPHDIEKVLGDFSYNNPATRKTKLGKLTTLFNYAVNHFEIIDRNPCRKAKIISVENKDVKVITKTEFNDLLTFIKKKDYALMAKIAFNSGLRVGEIYGLTYDCIGKNYLTINKQWNLNSQSKYGFVPTKTKNSNRTVPISKQLIKDIYAFRRENQTDINNRIFYKSNTTSSFGVYLKRNLDGTKFEGFTPHCFRHSYVSALIEQGVDYETISNLIGDILTTTMKIYSHVNTDSHNKVIKVIENYF